MIQNLANQAIKHLKENYPLPNKGILAGGSLGNLIWEYKSNNKAVINDIDVFVLDKRIEIEDTYPKRDSNGFSKKPGLVIENITHPYEDMVKKNKDSFYQITSTDQIGFINYINYDSNKEGISNIINAFDFNCTQVGYDLATNEFLWTKEFEEFINTGKILCTNLQSPVHSLVRLPKKCEDLNVEFPKSEMQLISYAISCNLPDINKRFISEKYMDYFIKYKDILKEYAIPSREHSVEQYFHSVKKIDMKIYSLTPTEPYRTRNDSDNVFRSYYDLLFYWRYIKDYPNRKASWKFHGISDYKPEYFDEPIDIFDAEILKDYYAYDKNYILTGKTVKEQVDFLKKMEHKLGKRKTQLILQSVKAKDFDPDDETDLMIMELCIRKASYVQEVNNKMYDI